MKLNIRGIDTPPDSDPAIISPSTEAQPTRRLLTPSTALNEFRVALDTWFPNMGPGNAHRSRPDGRGLAPAVAEEEERVMSNKTLGITLSVTCGVLIGIICGQLYGHQGLWISIPLSFAQGIAWAILLPVE